MENFGVLEIVIAVCVAGAILGVVVVFGGGLMFLIGRRNRGLRQAAQSWKSTTGKVLESRVAHHVYFQLGITEEEAQARVKAIKDANKPKPIDAVAAVLSVFGDPGQLLGDLITDGGAHDSGDWPLVVYEYEVGAVNYVSNRVRVEDVNGPTTGGVLYARPLLKRYPKGAKVTVYYNPQNPKESALEH